MGKLSDIYVRKEKELPDLIQCAISAGLSHNPDEIPRFIEHSYSDLVIGTRTVKTNTPMYRKVLSFVDNFIYNCSLEFPASILKRKYFRDISSGYRRYSNRAMKLILSKEIESKSLDILFETVMYVYRNRLAIS